MEVFNIIICFCYICQVTAQPPSQNGQQASASDLEDEGPTTSKPEEAPASPGDGFVQMRSPSSAVVDARQNSTGQAMCDMGVCFTNTLHSSSGASISHSSAGGPPPSSVHADSTHTAVTLTTQSVLPSPEVQASCLSLMPAFGSQETATAAAGVTGTVTCAGSSGTQSVPEEEDVLQTPEASATTPDAPVQPGAQAGSCAPHLTDPKPVHLGTELTTAAEGENDVYTATAKPDHQQFEVQEEVFSNGEVSSHLDPPPHIAASAQGLASPVSATADVHHGDHNVSYDHTTGTDHYGHSDMQPKAVHVPDDQYGQAIDEDMDIDLHQLGVNLHDDQTTNSSYQTMTLTWTFTSLITFMATLISFKSSTTSKLNQTMTLTRPQTRVDLHQLGINFHDDQYGEQDVDEDMDIDIHQLGINFHDDQYCEQDVDEDMDIDIHQLGVNLHQGDNSNDISIHHLGINLHGNLFVVQNNQQLLPDDDIDVDIHQLDNLHGNLNLLQVQYNEQTEPDDDIDTATDQGGIEGEISQ
ncbi:hypothetical protein ACOMHN_049420 [Nucella lapillus]